MEWDEDERIMREHSPRIVLGSSLREISTSQVSYIKSDKPTSNSNIAKEEENNKSNIQCNMNLKLDASRITQNSQLFDSLKCQICDFLCTDPVSSNCCDSLVCRFCFNDNLEKNRQCHNCKIKDSTFSSPTKFMIKIFNDVLISCAYYQKNNTESVCKANALKFNEVFEHEKFCEANPKCLKKCDKCKLFFEKDKSEEHNCVSELVIVYEKTKAELQRIKQEEEEEKNDELAKAVKFSLKLHNHVMIKVNARRSSTKCSLCCISDPKNEYYFCYSCSLSICSKCWEYCYEKEPNTE